jgi:RNA polymerase sigma-70 factor (family 1)
VIEPLHSDSELILLWKDGNEQAFELLYKKHVTVLITLARRKLADKALAEDFVHDAFISFYKKKADLPIDISVSAYLYVSLRNSIFSYYRKDALGQKYITNIAHSHTDTDHSTVEQIEAKEFEERLNKEIKKLPPQCKIVFELSRKEHLSNKEIGRKLDLSENTIEQHIRRALKQLKNSFKDYFKN